MTDRIKVTKISLSQIKAIKDLVVKYESSQSFKRQVGITCEVGEVLISWLFELELINDNINKGFDAFDTSEQKVQIKAVSKKPHEAMANTEGSRLSKFSLHEFECCYLVIFDKDYFPQEIWLATYTELEPVLENNKKRNPTIRQFKKVANKVVPSSEKLKMWK